MRLHHLTMTAFGPYADSATVDFDELNDAGIFLLTGPTGAGKTSVLDAVCFALYGVVPGVREVRTLRSHHAASGVAPEVVLETTIGTVRYRVRRSPEWHRPKKRGDGTTRENACASLTVIEDDGTERLVSSRVAEVGHELTMVLGMSSEQFMQVVMLPQGAFQKFLHATSDERQVVLQKLFHTQRFARIEEWMRDRTRDLGERAAQAERQVRQLLATMANRAGTALPEVLQEDTLGDVGAIARAWADDTLVAARVEHADAAVAERDAHEALERVRLEEQRAVQVSTAWRRHAEAHQVLQGLADTEARAADDRAALSRHEAALLVRPLLQPLADLQVSATAATVTRDDAVAALEALPVELQPATTDGDGCSAAQRTVTDRLAQLRAVLPREAACHRVGSDLQSVLEAREQLRGELAELVRRAEQLPAEQEEVRRQLTETQLLATGLADARAELESATARHEAASRLPAARAAHALLLQQHVDAREQAATARERHLGVVERRLAGIAAELAAQLEQDSPCQVCGSTDHPAPAAPADDAVTEQDQQLAAEEADRLRAVVDRIAAQVADSAGTHQALEAAAGGLSEAESAHEVDLRRAAVTDAETAAAATADLAARADAVDREHAVISGRLLELREQVAGRESEIASLRNAFAEAAREVAEAVGPAGGSVEETLGRLEEARHRLDAAADALEAHETLQARVTEALAHADAEAGQRGFGSATEAAEALLDEETVDSLRRSLQERDERGRVAAGTLAELSDVLADAPAPDLEAARSRLATATEEWRQANAALATHEQCAGSLASLAEQLEGALASWEPAREEHATAESMSKLVRGMGGDNQLQMRLSSYVLATRLDQVLDAANERLSQMRDQRYGLRRCGKARGGTRAGLGLEVLDTWTGEARAPSTLSGGETFVVSLALALGLADVVGEESGGVRVDTLFIDEGFGMLDPETLDDVMDRIDALRAGGRTVGVVSHVTELRARIPTQLHVERGKSGSTVSVRTLVA